MAGKYWIIVVVVLVIIASLLGPDLYKFLNKKSGYIVTNFLPWGGKIYYLLPKVLDVDLEMQELKAVDRNSFQILNDFYAKDKNQVFFQGEAKTNIDVNSFQILLDVYSKDKRAVYYNNHNHKNPFTPTTLEEITGADANTFQEYENAYGQDKNAVYYTGEILPDIDLTSFKVLPYGYAKDKQAVYYYGQKIAGADPLSFETLEKGSGRYYAQDKQGIYSFGKLLKVDKDSFDYPIISVSPTATKS